MYTQELFNFHLKNYIEAKEEYDGLSIFSDSCTTDVIRSKRDALDGAACALSDFIVRNVDNIQFYGF